MIQIKEKKCGQTPGNDFCDKNVSRDLTFPMKYVHASTCVHKLNVSMSQICLVKYYKVFLSRLFPIALFLYFNFL